MRSDRHAADGGRIEVAPVRGIGPVTRAALLHSEQLGLDFAEEEVGVELLVGITPDLAQLFDETMKWLGRHL